MNTIQKNTLSKRKRLAISLALLLAVLVGYFLTAYYVHQWPFELPPQSVPAPTINYGPTTAEQKNNGQTTKNNVTGNSQEQLSSQPVAPNAGTKTPTSVAITSANISSGTLYIRASIDTVADEGTCLLSMKGPSDKTYTADAGVQPLASNTTCKGFNIPVSSLSPGNWEITIVFENVTHIGSSTKLVEVK